MSFLRRRRSARQLRQAVSQPLAISQQSLEQDRDERHHKHQTADRYLETISPPDVDQVENAGERECERGKANTS
jgi:hypothetical protein